MTIECYCSNCKFHGIHEGEEGPFCFEIKCKNPYDEPTYRKDPNLDINGKEASCKPSQEPST